MATWLTICSKKFAQEDKLKEYEKFSLFASRNPPKPIYFNNKLLIWANDPVLKTIDYLPGQMILLSNNCLLTRTCCKSLSELCPSIPNYHYFSRSWPDPHFRRLTPLTLNISASDLPSEIFPGLCWGVVSLSAAGLTNLAMLDQQIILVASWGVCSWQLHALISKARETGKTFLKFNICHLFIYLFLKTSVVILMWKLRILLELLIFTIRFELALFLN